jgi:hypothetical protein
LIQNSTTASFACRRNSSGYYSAYNSDPGGCGTAARAKTAPLESSGGINGAPPPAYLKKQSAPGRYNSLASSSNSKAESGRKGLLSCGPVDFAHIRPRVDTGLAPPPALGLKKSNSAVRIREPFAAAVPVVQKRSEPSVLPSQVRPGCGGATAGGSGPFKVPDRPGGGAFNRNSAQRQSLTRLFSRNGDKAKKANSLGRDVRTPFGETGGCAAPASTTADRRSQFIKKRSITSLSLFSGGGKKEEDHGGGGGGRPEPVKVLLLYDSFLLSYWSLSSPFSSAIGRRDFLFLSLVTADCFLLSFTGGILLHCKEPCRKFETNIPRKGIARPQSQFQHSCVCERSIYSHNRSAYSSAEKYVDRSWEYINRSQTHECGN